MQPVVDLTCLPMERLYDILIIIALSIIIIQLWNFIEQSVLMRYYRFYEENCLSLQYKWMIHFEESIQVAYVKVDKYTLRDWRMYNEGKDSGYTDGYNQGLLEGNDNGWDEAWEYYQNIFERELCEAKQQWKEDGENNEYSEELSEEYEELEVDDEWSSYGVKRDQKQTEPAGWWREGLKD